MVSVTAYLPREATAADLPAVGRLLHDFNAEFGEPTPAPDWLASRVGELRAGGETAVLVSGDEPVAIAVVRFRLALWSEGLEAYLAELYVVPALRGQGIGTALMEAVMQDARDRGAVEMHIGVDEVDADTMRFYERLGFTNRSGDGVMFFYEREF
jgi:GNAT superfamily N-acetyltransferase